METKKIERLEELLGDFLAPSRTIVDHDVTRLTAAGENYGSLMVAVDVSVKDGDKDGTVQIVAKMPPPNEFLQKAFATQTTFRLEIEFYKVIVPRLREFERRQGIRDAIDCFPEYYGGRINLDPGSDVVDDDAVLLLENLKVSGFEVCDRTEGFDFDTTLLILRDLARFHSIPLAMKMVKPEEFRLNIKPFFEEFTLFEMPTDARNTIIDATVDIISENEDCRKIAENVREILETNCNNMAHPKNSSMFVTQPFSTIIHTDLWVNNIMIKFENGKAVENKFIDFQLYEYGSPARDVIFFLFASVQLPILKQHLEYFITYYHQNLLEHLTKLKCNTEQFSRENFDVEIELAVKRYELMHCLMMLNPIYAPKGSVQEIHEITEEILLEKKPIPDKHKERAAFIVNKFHEKTWV